MDDEKIQTMSVLLLLLISEILALAPCKSSGILQSLVLLSEYLIKKWVRSPNLPVASVVIPTELETL